MEELSKRVKRALGVKKAPKGKLAKIAAPVIDIEAHEDPMVELRQLMRQHKNLVKKSVAVEAMVRDRIFKNGDVMTCDIPDDRKNDFRSLSDVLKDDAKKLESKIEKVLRDIPIYKCFLSKVFGCGTIVAAYLIADIDIRKANKVSNLRRFCGLAVIDGRLERRTPGRKSGYNGELRMRLYQMFSSLWKNAAKRTPETPNGATSKYLEIWRDYKNRMQNSSRYDATKNTLIEHAGEGVRKGAKSVIHATGWHKAADVFIEDLYIAWRSLEGLPVWPSYNAAKLGYSHGGKVCVNEPRLLTIDEALSTIGDVGRRAANVLSDDEEELAAE